MQTEPRPYISEFIKLIMPDASERDQLDAQRDLDGFLDIIDEIDERLRREESCGPPLDKTADCDTTSDVSISKEVNPDSS